MPEQPPGPGISEAHREAVLAALHERRREAKAFVKAKHLADRLELDSRTIGRVFWHLEREGYLAVHSAGNHVATVYRMTLAGGDG